LSCPAFWVKPRILSEGEVGDDASGRYPEEAVREGVDYEANALLTREYRAPYVVPERI
jgi:hypothetical protein